MRSDARAAREMTCNSRKSSRGSQDDNGDTAQCVASTVSCERHKLVSAGCFQGHAAFACSRCSQGELQRGAFRTSPSRFFNFLSSNKLVVCSELSTLAALNLWAALNLCPNSPGCHWGRWLLSPLCHQSKSPRGFRRERNLLAADEQVKVNTTSFKLSVFVSYHLTPSHLRIFYCKSSREQRGQHCALASQNLSAATDLIGSL